VANVAYRVEEYTWSGKLILEMMITEGINKKGRTISSCLSSPHTLYRFTF